MDAVRVTDAVFFTIFFTIICITLFMTTCFFIQETLRILTKMESDINEAKVLLFQENKRT